MATKVKRKTPAETPEDTPDESPVEGAGLFSDVSMKEDDYVRLLRRDDLEKTMVFHGKLAPGEATSEKIAELFGGGFYKAVLFTRDERGSYVIAKTRTIKLPGPYKPPMGVLPGIGSPAPAAAANGKTEIGTITGGGDINAFLNATVLSTFMDLIKTMKEVSTRPTPATDPMLLEMMRSQATVQTKIIELIAAGNQGDSKKELLEMLSSMKELMAPPPAAAVVPGGAASTVSDMVKGMKELMGLKDIVEGKETADPESLMWGAAGKALDMLPQLMGKGKGENVPVTAPEGRPALPPGTPKWKMLLLVQKKRLLEAASYGLDPATAAETALTFLPQQMHGVLAEFLAMPDHVNVAVQTIPELNEFQQWTANFFAELQQQFMGEEEEDAEEGSERETGAEG